MGRQQVKERELRADLECAMAAVITNPAAKQQLERDPALLSTEFELDAVDADRLVTMAADLSALTGSFVAKRTTFLRWNVRRTFGMLGPDGPRLMQEFVASYPAVESFREEVEHFGSFVVEELARRDDGTPWSEVVVEMARFERARARSFWAAIDRFDQGPVATDARASAGCRRLVPAAGIEEFRRDLRELYHGDAEPDEPPAVDPCVLAFVHTRSSWGFRVFRLTDGERRLLASLPLSADLVASSDVARLLRLRIVESA